MRQVGHLTTGCCAVTSKATYEELNIPTCAHNFQLIGCYTNSYLASRAEFTVCHLQKRSVYQSLCRSDQLLFRRSTAVQALPAALSIGQFMHFTFSTRTFLPACAAAKWKFSVHVSLEHTVHVSLKHGAFKMNPVCSCRQSLHLLPLSLPPSTAAPETLPVIMLGVLY